MTQQPDTIGLDNKPQAQRDLVDLAHEISGLNVGRMHRFSVAEPLDFYGDNIKEKKAQQAMSMLAYLLEQDALYAQLYSEVEETINKAHAAAQNALFDIDQRLEDAQKTLQHLHNNAAGLHDGTKVFRSVETGAFYTEEGRKLSDDEAQGLEAGQGASTWEDYSAAKDALAAAQTDKAEIETYKTDVLDTARARMLDEDNPPTAEELEQIKQDIHAKRPEILTRYYRQEGLLAGDKPQSISAASESAPSVNSNAPPMTAHFNQARLDIPDMAERKEVAPMTASAEASAFER